MTSHPSPDVEAFWREYSAATGASGSYQAWAFGWDTDPDMQTALGRLVVDGDKRATTAVLADYEDEGEPLPRPGEHSVILDGHGVPLCIIRTTAVEVRRFGDVDEAFAHREGEGDRSLAWWREAHIAAFGRAGRVVVDDTLVVLETFDLVWPRADSR